ncbi:MAG: hypothetical protein JRH13_09860 [Deltaproteobacteria bacterium]|nr:hypothetical protein [Deltaproteobacteria bacterium]MBW2015351.1 hypothetical protein [Deltaproteobacteria bacterium]MBW2129656.1 hypothetical protein [Deltaproteobacteria bacterium]MBW2303071.1 hypothetical protein [Deltaproteobacteria bacterium]
MIIRLENGRSIDTSTDLNAPERHILQKLLFWSDMAESLEEFNRKKEEAFRKGWNRSGPVSISRNMKEVLSELEKKLIERLAESTRHGEKKSRE